jgi:hypothetical protein
MSCTGVSIGLSFDLAPVQLGAIAPATQPLPDPCADAGP